MIKNKLPLVLIILLASSLRVYGINWDQETHLHPDERMLIMVAERVDIPSQLNPDFFNYGSLPIYILKGVSQSIDAVFHTQVADYNGMLYVGRYLSILFDLATVLIIYKIAKILFSTSSNNNESRLRATSRSSNNNIALLSSFFYAVAFFPIQNSHFFVVDVFLTFFTTLLLFLLLKYLDIPSRHGCNKMVVLLGVIFAAMLATKFTAIIFLPLVSLIIILHYGKNLKATICNLSIFYLVSSSFFFLFMPYAFLSFRRFFDDISTQIKMNSDPYIFPYTLQYVGTLPYLYFLKNILFWDLGPIISVLSLVGLLNFIFTSRLVRRYVGLARRIIRVLFEPSREQYNKLSINNQQLAIFIFFLFYLFYFLIIGRSAVKFMRYMLPIYPFLTILAGYGLHQINRMSFLRKQESIKYFKWIPTFVGMTMTLIWSSMFINIYSQKHTRIAATEWILENIPYRSTLAIEHWDDGLPLAGGENYNHVEMTLYDQPDNEEKWEVLNQKLKTADYIILSSNRLYVPLQKLSDCKKYKSCYPKTAEYYRRLFQGENVILGRSETTTPESLFDSERVIIPSSDNRGTGMTEVRFKKVAEFTVYPSFQISNFKFQISDDSADESFTVYDHPKVLIFKKI